MGPARPDGRRPARAGWAALGCAALATVAVLLALGPMATNRPTISAVDPGATDAGSLARLRTLNGHVGTVMDLAFSADGALLASIGSDGAVLLWDAARGGLAWALPTADPTASRPLAARRAAFAPDGGALAVGYADGGVRLWDVATGDALRLLDHDAAVESLAFSPSGRVLAVGTGDGRVRWWDPASGRGLRTLVGHQSPVRAVAFAPDGRSMASADWAGTVRLWDVASGRSTHGATVGTLVTALAFSPDGTTLAAGGWGGVGLWDTARGIEVGHLGQAPGTQQVVFSPDGLELAALGGDGTLLRWDIARGRVERRWRSVDAPSIGALSSDGQLVALAPIAASNAEIGVWAAR